MAERCEKAVVGVLANGASAAGRSGVDEDAGGKAQQSINVVPMQLDTAHGPRARPSNRVAGGATL